MLFSGDEALKDVDVLSGGEKVRCVLSKLMLSGANFLTFDEPTNHLDMEAITALNEGLKKFKGNDIYSIPCPNCGKQHEVLEENIPAHIRKHIKLECFGLGRYVD